MYFHYDSRQWITTETWIRLISNIISQCSCFPVNETFFTSSQREKRLFFKDYIQTLQHISCPLCESSPVLTPAWRSGSGCLSLDRRILWAKVKRALRYCVKLKFVISGDRWQIQVTEETLKMLTFTQRLVSSETLQLSLFSPSPRYSVISNQIITLLPTIVMTSCIVVYMGAWFTGAWSARGRGCTAAAGSVCSVHINEMFHMKPC